MKTAFGSILAILILTLLASITSTEVASEQGLPDLVVTVIEAPASASTQQPIDVSWTVTNQGDSLATCCWYDDLCLSTDDQLDNTDIFFTRIWRPESLSAGGNYSTTQTVTIPEVPSGNYYLLVRADCLNNLYESNEDNNVLAQQITIQVPDLVVTAIDAPTSASTQQYIVFSWTVQNQGDGAAMLYRGNSPDAIYLSADDQLDESDTLLTWFWSSSQTLPAGESFTATQACFVPAVPSGDYFLLTKADIYNYVYESDEDNNVLAQPITIGVPDLVVTDMDAPASVSTQQRIQVSWTVKNQGDGNITQGWYDVLYLSTDDQLDVSDTSLLPCGRSEVLPAGESFTVTQAVSVPAVTSGTWYLLVVADYYHGIYESNEDNNVLAQPITIQVPDLVVTAIDAPASASTQEQIQVSWTVQNQGDGNAAASWYYRLYISADEQLDSSDTYIWDYFVGQSLVSNESYTMTVTMTVPIVTSGTYYLLVKADDWNWVYESNEENNILAKEITIRVPDLVVIAIDAPAYASTQEQIQVSWTVQNQGDGNATTGWYDGLYWSTDTQLDASDGDICGMYGCYHHGPLDAGESYDAGNVVTIPCMPAGKYYLLAVSDRGIYGNGNIYESDEGNNILAKQIIIQVPDLVVTSIDAPALANPQQQITVSWTITNQGDGKSAVMWGLLEQAWSFGGDWLYLSTDGQLDASDTVIARHRHGETPASHEFFTATEAVTIPAVAPGNYYLLVQADYYNYLYESREWNNVLPRLITIVEPGAEGGLSESSSNESALTADILSQKATLGNGTVAGDLNGSFDFAQFEIVSVNSGSFAGKGFSQGEWTATLEGISYRGDWQGVSYLVAPESKIYLKGTISGGEASGIAEGYLTESIPGSGVYDRYHAVWRLGRLGDQTAYARLNLDGNLTYLASTEYPSTQLYVLQTSVEGTAYGHYTESLSTVLTHLWVADGSNPYSGQGFSIVSYSSASGQGEGWTYDKEVSPGKVEMNGLFTSPLLGIVSGTLDETRTPRTLSLTIERIDLGLPPAPDLKVQVWGPKRVSPGQTIDYIIEYRNDGVKGADDVVVGIEMPELLEYISSSKGGIYLPSDSPATELWFESSVAAKTKGYKTLTVKIPWGLSQGTVITVSAHSSFASQEIRDGFCPNEEEIVSGAPIPEIGDGGWTGRPQVTFTDTRLKIRRFPIRPLVQRNADGTCSVTFRCREWIDHQERYCDMTYDPIGGEWISKSCTNWTTVKADGYLKEKTINMDCGLACSLNPDACPDYNRDTWSYQVTTAGDPNIKYGPEGNVLPGQKMDYEVEYENEGEGIAFGVYFTDTLDEDLDDSTLLIGPVFSTVDGSEIAPAGTYNPATRTITWLVGEVGPGEGGYADIGVNVRNDATDGTEIINFATVYFPSVPETTRTNGIVSIVSLNQPPVVEAGGPYLGNEGSPIPFTASGSNDPDGTIAQYEWDFGDGSTGTGASPTHAYGDNGVYTVTLTVTDDDGLTSVDTAEVTVSNVAPTVEAGINQSIEVFNPVSCKGNFTDPGWLDHHTAKWDWGDGTTSGGTVTEVDGSGNVTGSHTYSLVGSYTVTLTVTDDDGGAQTDTLNVEVIQKYAIWGNSTDAKAILWSGSGEKIKGNVNSNGGITVSGSNNAIDGIVYYTSKLAISGSKDTFTSSQKVSPRPMPVHYELSNYQLGAADNEAKRAQNAGKYHLITGNYNVSKSGTVLDGLYYVKGNVALSGSSMKGTFTIVAEGTIQISGSAMNWTPYSSGLLFFSKGSSLALSGSNSSLGGIIYVPKGQITISGSGNKINGSLFGDKVTLSGSNMIITAK